MNIPVLAGKTTFKNNTSPKSLGFEDITDYSSFGVDAQDVIGVLKCTGPAGVFYSNTDFNAPDIDGASPPLEKDGITLPLDTSSNIQVGDYELQYSVHIAGFEQTAQVYTYDNTAKTITVTGDWRTQFNAGDAQLELLLNDAPAGSLTPVSVAYDAVTDRTTITLASLALVGDPSDYTILVTYTLEIVTTFTYAYAHVDPEVKIEATANCDCAKFKSIDITEYGDYESLTRTHTIEYPATSGQEDYVTASAEVNLNTLWTKTYSVTISTILIYLEDGLYIETTVVGQKDVNVSCDAGLCKVSVCIKNVYERWLELLAMEPSQAPRLERVLIKILNHYMLYSTAKSCGDPDAMQENLEAIQNLASGCNCGCGCSDDNSKKSIQVVPLCGESAGADTNVIVQCLDSTITISVNVVGNDKTYTLSLNQSIVQGIVEDTDLDDLNNVSTASKVSGQILVWNGTAWVNQDMSFFETSPAQLIAAEESKVYGSPRRLKQRIIHPYDDTVAYKIGQRVDWQGDLFEIINADTLAGQTPATTPTKFKAFAPDCKVYVAELVDLSSANPTVTVRKNNTGTEPTWSFEGTGEYKGLGFGNDTVENQEKTKAFISSHVSGQYVPHAVVGTADDIQIFIFNSDTQTQEGPLNVTIRVEIYP